MGLVGNNSINIDKEKTKKIVKLSIILLVILLIINIGLIGAVYYANLKTLKLNINSAKKEKFKQDLFVFEEDGDIYVSIKNIATLVGYKAQNGGYKEYSEDSNKCYVENDNEVAEFELDSNIIYKYAKNSRNEEIFEFKKAVRQINGELYASAECISIACNTRFKYSKDKNQIDIYTLDYYVNLYVNVFGDKSSLKDEKTATFTNKKAVLYDRMVVIDKDGRYGVCDLTGKELIGTKYASIEFLEASKDFIVKTEEGKVGIVSYDATTKIKPEFDTIKEIDSKEGRYLVSTNEKQGIIDKDGKVIIYPEYDKIGLDDIQVFTKEKNQYILLNTYIPVCKENKWGWFNIEGKSIVAPKYDELGCRNKYNSSITGDPVLTIPEYNVVVVKKDDKYGLVTGQGAILLQPALQRVYSTTEDGKIKYYMLYNNQDIDIERHFTENGISKVTN